MIAAGAVSTVLLAAGSALARLPGVSWILPVLLLATYAVGLGLGRLAFRRGG